MTNWIFSALFMRFAQKVIYYLLKLIYFPYSGNKSLKKNLELRANMPNFFGKKIIIQENKHH